MYVWFSKIRYFLYVYINTVNETPCLQDIFKLIVPHYAADWEDLGVLLDIPRHYLKTIKVDNPCSVERCCEKMFTYWLSSKDIVSTWQNLLAAIELLPMSSCDKMEKGDNIQIIINYSYVPTRELVLF